MFLLLDIITSNSHLENMSLLILWNDRVSFYIYFFFVEIRKYHFNSLVVISRLTGFLTTFTNEQLKVDNFYVMTLE